MIWNERVNNKKIWDLFIDINIDIEGIKTIYIRLQILLTKINMNQIINTWNVNHLTTMVFYFLSYIIATLLFVNIYY